MPPPPFDPQLAASLMQMHAQLSELASELDHALEALRELQFLQTIAGTDEAGEGLRQAAAALIARAARQPS